MESDTTINKNMRINDVVYILTTVTLLLPNPVHTRGFNEETAAVCKSVYSHWPWTSEGKLIKWSERKGSVPLQPD